MSAQVHQSGLDLPDRVGNAQDSRLDHTIDTEKQEHHTVEGHAENCGSHQPRAPVGFKQLGDLDGGSDIYIGLRFIILL